MLRMGRNPKDDKSEATADHTPQPSTTNYASAATSASAGAGSAAGTGASGGAANDYYQSSGQTSNTSRAVTESESLARDIKEGTLSGFVGNGTVLTGEASFKGMLRVDGHLSGRVSSQDGTLIVSTNGQVDANVEVSIAQIYGTVNGDIVATTRIEMGRVARVNGNIETPALVIENGAVFEGSCRMVQVREAQNKRQSGATASSGASGTASAATDGNNGSKDKATAAAPDVATVSNATT